MSVRKYSVLVTGVLLVVGCAETYQPRHIEAKDILADYSLMQEGDKDQALIGYWKKGVDWRSYEKIIITPVAIRKSKELALQDMTHADYELVKELLGYWMQEALKKGFKVVNDSGAGTLTTRSVITDIKASPDLKANLPSAESPVRVLSSLKQVIAGNEFFSDKGIIETTMTDSTTGELLIAAYYAHSGKKALLVFANKRADMEQTYKYWAPQLGYRLCLHQGRRDCRSPEDEWKEEEQKTEGQK